MTWAVFSAIIFFFGIPIAVLLASVGIEMIGDRDIFIQALLGVILVACIPVCMILFVIYSIAHINFTAVGILETVPLWVVAVAGGVGLGFLVAKIRSR